MWKVYGKVEQKLIENFWPGPLTIVFNKKEIVPKMVTAGLDTVGVRMPSSIIARELIEMSGVPIAAPSANISGKPSGTLVEDIIEELDGKVEYIIDNGIAEIGVESTVVRIIKEVVHILRPGKITKEQIEKLGIKVHIEKQVLSKCEEDEKVMSPGMKYKHYAPNTECVLVYSKNEDKITEKIKGLAEKNNGDVLVLVKDKNLKKYKVENKIGIGDTEEEIGQKIFTTLRKVDSYNVKLVIIEGIDKKGLGLAIMNRLIRACENNYIEC